MKFIKTHKIQLIVILICLVLVILAGFAFYKMFYPSTGNLYGNRLNEKVAIDDAVISKIKEDLIKGGANSVDYNNNVRIIKFFVDTDLAHDKLNVLTKVISDNLSEKVTGYYDVEIYFTNKNKKEFPAIAYLGKGTKEFNFTFNKEVSKDE